MNDGQALLRAICENPSEDTPRLIYADWLDEQGSLAETTHAELIRVQCELSRLPTTNLRYPELHVRQLQLIAENELRWLGEWSDRLVRWEFQRGFLHSITTTLKPFVNQGPGLFAEHPVQRVSLVDDAGESLLVEAISEAVSSPTMCEVRILETAGSRRDEPMRGMYGGILSTNAWLSALSKAEHINQLEELHLNGDTRSGRHGIEPAAWSLFCQARHLRKLKHLDISDMYSNDRKESITTIVELLGRSTFARSLKSLSLADCQLTDESARLLASAPLDSLEELDASGCMGLGVDGLRAIFSSLGKLNSFGGPTNATLQELATSPRSSQLRTLRLDGHRNRGEFDEWSGLFQAPQLSNLKSLTIGTYDSIPPGAIAGLVQTSWVSKLRRLRVVCNNLSMEHLSPLFERPVDGPTPLHDLGLRECEGIGKALANWPGLAGITSLDLTRMQGQDSDADTTALLKSSYLTNRLSRLDLSGSCQTLNNVNHLADCKSLEGLSWLAFGWNGLSSERMNSLLKSPFLRNLESLHLASMYDEDETAALLVLAESNEWPRLRDAVVGSGTGQSTIATLYRRFGPRLRVWADC